MAAVASDIEKELLGIHGIVRRIIAELFSHRQPAVSVWGVSHWSHWDPWKSWSAVGKAVLRMWDWDTWNSARTTRDTSAKSQLEETKKVASHQDIKQRIIGSPDQNLQNKLLSTMLWCPPFNHHEASTSWHLAENWQGKSKNWQGKSTSFTGRFHGKCLGVLGGAVPDISGICTMHIYIYT